MKRTSVATVAIAAALALSAAFVPAAGAGPVARGENNDDATLILVAGSAWAGSAPTSPLKLANWVAPYATSRGYRVVSIATAPGLEAVQSVRNAVKREARHEPTD